MNIMNLDMVLIHILFLYDYSYEAYMFSSTLLMVLHNTNCSTSTRSDLLHHHTTFHKKKKELRLDLITSPSRDNHNIQEKCSLSCNQLQKKKTLIRLCSTTNHYSFKNSHSSGEKLPSYASTVKTRLSILEMQLCKTCYL